MDLDQTTLGLDDEGNRHSFGSTDPYSYSDISTALLLLTQSVLNDGLMVS